MLRLKLGPDCVHSQWKCFAVCDSGTLEADAFKALALSCVPTTAELGRCAMRVACSPHPPACLCAFRAELSSFGDMVSETMPRRDAFHAAQYSARNASLRAKASLRARSKSFYSPCLYSLQQ
eukprot:1175772-Pleurochrysis_carterae.AAC.2